MPGWALIWIVGLALIDVGVAVWNWNEKRKGHEW